MTDSVFEKKLIDALDALERGQSPEDILRENPGLAPELQPYLETAQQLAELPATPSPQAVFASRRAMLQRAAQERAQAQRSASPPPWRRLFFALAVFAVLLAIAAGLLGTRVQEAVPGDSLYGLKRGAEDVRLLLAPPAQKEALRQAFEDERNHEVYVMLRTGREGLAGYTGEIKAVGPETWEVGNITVQLTEETLVQGEPEVGARVAAHCRIEDGEVIAESLAVLEDEDGAGSPE